MKNLQIGVIIGGAVAQKQVNLSHGEDLKLALIELGHSVVMYDLADSSTPATILRDFAGGKLDIVFNNAAGKRGGDGTVEGMLELAGIPFVGSDTHATATAFDKETTKRLVAATGVPVVDGFVISNKGYDSIDLHKKVELFGYPVIVKAVRGSDSLGVSLVSDPAELEAAISLAFEHDSRVLIEKFIDRSTCIDCMVLGSDSSLDVLLPIESVFEGAIYTDEVADQTLLRKPEIDTNTLESIKDYTARAHTALGCRDYTRSDFLIDKQGNIFFLEINAHAGLGKEGCTDSICRMAKGWSYAEMVSHILNLALQRYS